MRLMERTPVLFQRKDYILLIAFFVDLGLEVHAEWESDGEQLDRIVELNVEQQVSAKSF